MLTWLGDLEGTQRLYAKTVNTAGDDVTSAQLIMDNVVSYKCTSSTLGVSVFAGVTRTGDGPSVTDTVFAGLIDPVNGVALTLPFATGIGAQVKTIQQEANGDFSLVYSTHENGTTLPKANRISGTTAISLWDTTVADLGNASDEFIKRYPNSWVSGNSDGVLYILSRHDQAYSDNASINLVRLRADGQLGSDDLKKPTNFQSPIPAAGAVKLTWADNSNSETNYLVGLTTSDFAHIEVLTALPANTETYTDTTALADVTYYYYVAPFQTDTGEFVLSDELEVTPEV